VIGHAIGGSLGWTLGDACGVDARQSAEPCMTTVNFQIENKSYEGWFLPANGRSSAPVVVLAHAWGGLGVNEQRHASRIAELGYAAFAMDVYGRGQRGTTPEQNQALMNPLLADRAELQKRLAANLAVALGQSGISGGAAAIGFCFGGLCVLDMARAGHDVKGVASFHGLFHPAPNLQKPVIKAKVLVEHGWQDPMVKPDTVVGLAAELDAAGADWQIHAHGRAVHAFTTEGVNNRAGGAEYDADADRRSFASLKDFLAELFRAR
jgi:dienelactone hydrolase